MDTIALLKSGFCDVDCVYFDPPYGLTGTSNYAEMYRFLEEYIYGDQLENLPHIISHAHRFVKKRNYEDNFREMLVAANHIPIWLFSYNDSSWKDIDYIQNVIREYRQDVIVEVLDKNYRYLYRRKQGRKDKSIEYLIVAR